MKKFNQRSFQLWTSQRAGRLALELALVESGEVRTIYTTMHNQQSKVLTDVEDLREFC
jgi:hypothetical protein